MIDDVTATSNNENDLSIFEIHQRRIAKYNNKQEELNINKSLSSTFIKDDSYNMKKYKL